LSVVRLGSIDTIAGPEAVAVIATGFWVKPCKTVQPEYASMTQVSTRPTFGRAVTVLSAAFAVDTGESLDAWTAIGTATRPATARRTAGRITRLRAVRMGGMRRVP
jgi:hypothetical protein